MADRIEEAKSGRAACRTCKSAIGKGELRFGEEFASQFAGDGEMGIRWHHLACAAKKMPSKLKAAMDGYEGEIPNKDEIDKIVAAGAGKVKEKPAAYPWADRATTSRAKCVQCEEVIEKGTFRVAVEREVDTGAFVTKGAGYLHPACVAAYVEKGEAGGELDAFLKKLRAQTLGMKPEEIDELVSLI